MTLVILLEEISKFPKTDDKEASAKQENLMEATPSVTCTVDQLTTLAIKTLGRHMDRQRGGLLVVSGPRSK